MGLSSGSNSDYQRFEAEMIARQERLAKLQREAIERQKKQDALAKERMVAESQYAVQDGAPLSTNLTEAAGISLIDDRSDISGHGKNKKNNKLKTILGGLSNVS